jgi:DNA polymerase I-like protein with 3'-5' exonuclease and polymerase domains
MKITGKVNVDFLEETIPYLYLTGSDVTKFFINPPKLQKTLAIDIETYAKNKFKKVEDSALYPHRAKIRTLQFFDGETLIILDFMDPDTYEYMLLDVFLAKALRKLLISHTLVAHNALFETCHLQNLFEAHGLKMKPLNIRCTALMYKLVVNAKTPHSKSFFTSLKDLSEQVLDYTPDKEEQMSNWGVKELLTENQLKYCAFDVILPYHIVRELVQYVEDYGMNEIFMLITEAQEPIAQMKNHGFPVDVAEHKRQWDEWKAKKDKFELECLASLNGDVDKIGYRDLLNMLLAKVTKAFQESMTYIIEEFKDNDKTKFLYNLKKELLFREETEQDHKGMRRALRRVLKNIDGLLLNPDSGKQVSDWLKENLSDDELEGWPLTDSGKDLKTDAEAFEDNDHIEVLSSVVGYKTNSKFSGMYGQKWSEFFMDMGDYVALPVNLNLLGADTGRLSSSKPNIQQAPAAMKLPDFRKILRSKNDDYVLICADYGQIEIRVAAELSREEVIRQAYRDGIDLHALTASRIGRIPIDQVTKDQRQAAKAINFGLLFLGGADSLKTQAKKSYKVHMTDKEAEDAVEGFQLAYPRLREWQLEVSTRARHNVYVKTKLGKHRRLFPDDTYNTSVNTEVQGSAAECMEKASVLVQLGIWDNEYDAVPLGLIHDEMIVQAHKSIAEEVRELVEEKMTEGFLYVFPGAPTKGLVEAHIGITWKEAK